MGQQQQNGSSGKSIRTCSLGCWNGCLISRVPLKSGEKRPLRASKWLDSLGESKDTAGDTSLDPGHLTDDDVGFQLPGVQDPVVADKTRAILDDQQLVTELNRLGLLAALDQLRVRLKDAKEFFRVGDLLPVQDTPPRITEYARGHAE